MLTVRLLLLNRLQTVFYENFQFSWGKSDEIEKLILYRSLCVILPGLQLSR